MKNKLDYIFNDIVSSFGANESSKVYSCIHVNDNTVEIIIEKTITERYPINEYDNVMELYRKLNRGGGRKVWRLKELI